MALEIIGMDRKHITNALEIYQWYVVNSTATFQIRDADFAEMEGLLFFDNPRYRSFEVMEDDLLIGYGIITRYKTREAYDNTAEITVYLAHTSTGKGYGAKVVSRLEEFAREQGMHVLIAQISGENEGSCKLFARNGYTKCAHYHEVGYKFGRSLDLVCYEKRLQQQ